MIELNNLSKTFGKTLALSDVSLSMQEGSFTSLLGPSGCGKSTTLRIIAGLDQPTLGSVRVNGKDVTQLTAAERNIAMVFQSYALYPHMTVRQNINIPLAMRNMTRLQRLPIIDRILHSARARATENAKKVNEIAAMLKIESLLERKPSELSGGQMQRVAVGRALVRDPIAFLLDEPLSNLDTKLRMQMRTEIVDLHKRTGKTFIYVTHDQSEAMSMSDKIAVFMEGRIVQVAPPRELFNHPATTEVASFVGDRSINLVPLKINGASLPPPFEGLVVEGNNLPENITLGIRPESMKIDPNGLISGHLERFEYFGSEMLITCRLNDGYNLQIAIDPGCELPATGDFINLTIKTKKTHIFDAKTGIRLDAILKEKNDKAKVSGLRGTL